MEWLLQVRERAHATPSFMTPHCLSTSTGPLRLSLALFSLSLDPILLSKEHSWKSGVRLYTRFLFARKEGEEIAAFEGDENRLLPKKQNLEDAANN
jgi:hypothetical protein